MTAAGDDRADAAGRQQPTLVSTDVDYCIVHNTLDHGDKKWRDCRFRQLFYFEDARDEKNFDWSEG